MCDDVPAFTDASVTLVIGIVRKFFMMVGFSGARMLLPGISSVFGNASTIAWIAGGASVYCPRDQEIALF